MADSCKPELNKSVGPKVNDKNARMSGGSRGSLNARPSSSSSSEHWMEAGEEIDFLSETAVKSIRRFTPGLLLSFFFSPVTLLFKTSGRGLAECKHVHLYYMITVSYWRWDTFLSEIELLAWKHAGLTDSFLNLRRNQKRVTKELLSRNLFTYAWMDSRH